MSNTNKHISKKLLAQRQSLMLHGLGFVTGDPSIRINYPYSQSPGIQVTTTEPGDSKWIYMMLPVTKGSLITDINIAHHRTGIQSHISLIRLVEQQEPISATVVHNGVIEKTVPSICIIGTSCQVVVNRSLMLKVCMDFFDTDDTIELGSVEVRYIPGYAALPEQEKQETVASYKREELITGLFNGSPVMNSRRPSFQELFIPKKRKKKAIF